MGNINKRQIREYIAVFEEEKTGGFSVWVPELPGCASQGETIEEAIANIKEAIELYLEDKDTIGEEITFKKQFTIPVKVDVQTPAHFQ